MIGGIVLLISILCDHAIAQNSCPTQWFHHGSSCYAFVTNLKANWIDAEAFCRNANSKLVEIGSADEDKFLRGHLTANHISEHFWVGGTDAFAEGKWVWMSTLDPLDYTGWNPGEPNNGVGAACMTLAYHLGYHWNDDFCTKTYDFICERESENPSIQVIG